jgi:hypothetical protein
MSKKTYGQLPGVTVMTSGGSVGGSIEESVSGVQLWGHTIVRNEGNSIKCQDCEHEEELPELLEMSNGFREVVYKMYVLGKFKREECSPDPEDIMDGLNKNKDWADSVSHRVDPNRIHWSGAGQSDKEDKYVINSSSTEIY